MDQRVVDFLKKVDKRQLARVMRLVQNEQNKGSIKQYEEAQYQWKLEKKRADPYRRPYSCKPEDFWTKEGMGVVEIEAGERGAVCFVCWREAEYEIVDKYGKYIACEKHAALLARKCGLLKN